ncbi:hypothetical protein EJ04DRAFT_41942 [Polyplosphaeria fusca]|uniref:F-box domain-containing protein n=1 Tax=Polyplosphaeria fusca TaxID=682080 RepID=A0A9P4R5U4_9PLEO|nr:hypothetical protein EJ04DRAFT_41942 [Polyplosphaeria fusca]
MSFLLGCFGWRPSRMPRAEEKTTLVWLLTLKILMIIPVAIAAFSAKNTYTSIRKHEELQQSPPYDKHVLLSQLLVYIGTMSLFPWLFISCALVLVWKGPWLFLYGVVDLGLLVTICIGLSMEGNYLPSSVKSCSTSKVTTWQVVDNHPSFFVQAASYDPNPNPQQKCKTFVTTWSLGVVVAFFQAVLAYIGIFFDEREHSLLNPFRPLFYFVLALIGGPFLFHAHITPRLRFSISYALKSLRHLFGQHPLIFPRPAPYTPNHDKPIHTQNPRLHAILTIEHVALNVVSHMHYEDVIALSLACRSVREAVFPSRDLAFRVPKLRARCCVPVTKAPCAYCKKEICSECHVLVSAKGVPGARHVEKCLPYCRTCYFRDFSKRGRRGAGAARACRCARDEGGVQEERGG